MAVVLDTVDFRGRDYCYIESRKLCKIVPVLIRRLKWEGVQVTGADGDYYYFDFGRMHIGWRAWDQMPTEDERKAHARKWKDG